MEKDIKDVTIEEYFSLISESAMFTIDSYASRTLYSMRGVLKNTHMVQCNAIDATEYKLLRRNANKHKAVTVGNILTDILNIGKNPSNMEREYLCVKHMQSREVIDEVIDGKYNKEYGIIHSKIYPATDLIAKLIQKDPHNTGTIKAINSNIPNEIFINFNPINTSGGLIEGKDYEKIYKYIRLQNSIISDDNSKYITVSEANRILGFSTANPTLRKYVVENKLPVFNVIIRYKIPSKKIFVNLDDVNLARKNKKYFIKQADIIEYNNCDIHDRNMINNLLRIMYKNYRANTTWISKEMGITISKLCKLYNDNTPTSNAVTGVAINTFLDYYKDKNIKISSLASILGFECSSMKQSLFAHKGFFGVKFTDTQIKNGIIPTSKAIEVVTIRSMCSNEDMPGMCSELSYEQRAKINSEFKHYKYYRNYLHKDKVQDYKDIVERYYKENKCVTK